MTVIATGGGSSAVAASAHAGCERFRSTDPLITRMPRKALAKHLGAPDTSAGIPEARWMRAMTFERLVQSDRFVSELLTKAVGQLELPRPGGVRRRSCRVTVDRTATELAQAHLKAVHSDEATMLTELALPFLDLEHEPGATPVKPDFAIVCPRQDESGGAGSWLIMGDAKDYERVRSRIDDARMLKGFLQVALGAESAACWSKLPEGMQLHSWGVLAVPRNAFLQPEAVVELLDDHRAEVRQRAQERLQVMRDLGEGRPTETELSAYVGHIEAAFDPATCVTCNLFAYCRGELRDSVDPTAVLIEIGVERLLRPAVRGIVDGTGEIGSAPPSVLSQVQATVSGLPEWTGRLRCDTVGLPGTVFAVLAKADAAALGVHGLALRVVTGAALSTWKSTTYAEPQSPQTRISVMERLGECLERAESAGAMPLHLVVPDKPTADVLVSIADSLAGIELSRLRWQRDLDEGREALTFDGQPAVLPAPLAEAARLAVSFLLEEDRARAFVLRQPIIELRATLAGHLVAGGPTADSGRLDYLLRWAEAASPLDHRQVSDEIAASEHTPGARLSNATSDLIHNAQRGPRADPKRYAALVGSELKYKCDVVDRVAMVLAGLADSVLRPVYRALEQDAQEVWGRRRALRASDLVRFSRTYKPWRNDQVGMLDADRKCAAQLGVLSDQHLAVEAATDAGNREVALATVVTTSPLRLQVASRRLIAGTEIVALHVNRQPVVERPGTALKIQGGSFKFGYLLTGPLEEPEDGEGLLWSPHFDLPAVALRVGDELVVANVRWFNEPLASGHEIKVDRPSLDVQSAPKKDCSVGAYEADSQGHRWCCRPHDAAEAEYADDLARRRVQGELNPETWPPLIDEDRFDVGADLSTSLDQNGPVPQNLTLDDVD